MDIDSDMLAETEATEMKTRKRREYTPKLSTPFPPGEKKTPPSKAHKGRIIRILKKAEEEILP